MIEAEGQPTLTIRIDAVPDIVFQDEGLQGPPGGSALPGDAIRVVGSAVHVDITRLSFAP